MGVKLIFGKIDILRIASLYFRDYLYGIRKKIRFLLRRSGNYQDLSRRLSQKSKHRQGF
jgi:hypothetical protein